MPSIGRKKYLSWERAKAGETVKSRRSMFKKQTCETEEKPPRSRSGSDVARATEREGLADDWGIEVAGRSGRRGEGPHLCGPGPQSCGPGPQR